MSVCFSVYRKLKLIDGDKYGRDHIYRQTFLKLCPYSLNPVIPAVFVLWYVITAQLPFSVLIFEYNDGSITYSVKRTEHRFGFTRFYPVAADLDLVIHPAYELNVAVRKNSCQIAASVHPSVAERVLYILFIRKSRPVLIAPCNLCTRDAQFTRYTYGT